MKLRWLLLTSVLVLLSARPASATIRYRVSVGHPEQHLFHVTMMVPSAGSELRVAIPAWCALYQIRDFAYRVQDVRAFLISADSSNPAHRLPVQKFDKQTWEIRPGSSGDSRVGLGDVQIEYAIFWDEPGPFSSQLNLHHAFLNLAEILLYVPDRRAEDTRLMFEDLPAAWRLAAELSEGEGDHSFRAQTYDELVDAPVELGVFDEFRFQGGIARIRVVVDGKSWSRTHLEETLRRIVKAETQLMREVPFEEYLFLFHFDSSMGGGGVAMEHSNSTAIAVSSDDFAASVAAHEFFHLWNVKRIRPQSLEPVDYTREQYTRALWFVEGVTNTYSSYALVRSGLWSRRQFFDDLAEAFAELDSRSARLWQSVEQASLDAWMEKYSLYHRPDFSIRFYNKGQILGVLMDLAIRDVTENRKSLDDVLRALNEEFARRGRFYDDSAGIRAVVEEISGRSFEDFFRRYIAGTDELPANQFLRLAGLELKSSTQRFADIGFWLGLGPDRAWIVEEMEPGSPSEAAGVRAGDVLLELDGEAFPGNPVNWLREHSPGKTVHLRLRRGGSEREVSFALAAREERVFRIEELPQATEAQRRIRDGILNGATD